MSFSAQLSVILSGYTRLPSDPPFGFAQGDRGVLRVTRGVLLLEVVWCFLTNGRV